MASSQQDVIFDAETEDRIEDEILVDTYGDYEKATAWLTYLSDQLSCPFQAECIKVISTSRLVANEVVMVIGMDDNLCEQDMFVTVNWQNRSISVPLSEPEGIDIKDETRQGISDWHYWLNSGRSLA